MKSNQKISIIFFLSLALIFLILDIRLFHKIQLIKFDRNASSLPFSAKSVMLDHVNSYIMSPLSRNLEEFLHLTKRFPKLSANQVSFGGVVIALIASKVVVNDSLFIRRIAIFIFLLRQFFDDLDGLVARIRMGLNRNREISLTGSSGYVVDGICDAIGFTAFLFALFLYSLRKRAKNENKYKLLSKEENSLNSSLDSFSSRILLRNHFLFGLQMLLSCVLWNRYIDAFHRILETDLNPIKIEIFKSRLQWIIMWAWRCFGNAHQLMNFFLVSVWLSKSEKFVEKVHYLGFVSLIGLSFLTEVHLNDSFFAQQIETYLKHISMNNK